LGCNETDSDRNYAALEIAIKQTLESETVLLQQSDPNQDVGPVIATLIYSFFQILIMDHFIVHSFDNLVGLVWF